ncbi:DMT family transporter [Pseudoroseomonas cervicalis]|uniref:DMT family transporter n=1 Tax=Teichococcus cervicalis TaxID=204525 RepID=UPI00278B620B|nr:DMT family transporter [Pseudoroseomonas cervicalis]MDQ1080296.1 drug/metabolite transporter (DMT)-like permease [Pseudoroseomonas cervicalis]
MNPLLQAALLTTAAAFVFNLETVLVKYLDGVPATTILLARTAGQILWVLPLLPREGLGLLRTRQLGMQLLRGLLSFVSWGLYYVGFLRLPLATATTLSFTSVLFVTALAGPLLGERVGLRRWAATLLGFAGVLLVVRPGVLPLDWPLAASLGSALFGAGIVLTTKALARTERTETIMLYIGLVATAGSLPVALPYLTWPGWGNAALLLGAAILGPAGMHLWINALRLADASSVAPISYVRLVFAALAGALLFAEPLDPYLAAGALLIVSSAIYITRQGAR